MPFRKGLAVCKKCFSVYDQDKMNPQYRTCIHQQGRSSKMCDEPLYQSGVRIPRPLCTYSYVSLIESLQAILSRPNMVELCNLWQQHNNSDPDLLCDVYDGLVWKELSMQYPSSLTDHTLSLGLALNVDWFQPFKHTRYSVGALYMSVLNIPRAYRFKSENVILVGIMPGPKEPKLNMNSYLQPIVSELTKLFGGVSMLLNGTHFHVKALLHMVVCDIPATRKVLALPGHSAKLGCSKCLKRFEAEKFGERLDYSGYDYASWVKRDFTEHRQRSREYRMLPNPTTQKAFEQEHGLRYSELVHLDYFNLIRCHVIDPMHNLFEGTAKFFTKNLLEKKLINCSLVSDRIKRITSPMKVGRLPTKIEANYSGFTADQWRNWCLIYSPIVLADAILPQIYTIWMFFVKACRLLCRRALRKSSVLEADAYLVKFCEEATEYFGKPICTPNMHLHLHIKECALDFGPIYGYWCFPFKRYNGTLKTK